MEQAVYVAGAAGLGFAEGDYTRLYFGAEFCQRLVPTTDELGTALDHAADRGMAFTLMTPYVTTEGLARVEPLLDALATRVPDAEVVVNDWGTLDLLRERYASLRPVLGRLMTKQKRGPRALTLVDKVPGTMRAPLRSISVELPAYRRFLAANGINRVELDNPLQGLEVDLAGDEPPLAGSLYTPFAYVSTTRMCLANGCESPRGREAGRIVPCGRECQRYTFTRTHPSMPVPVILKGSAQFVRNDELPADLAALGIDRLVVEPEVPV